MKKDQERPLDPPYKEAISEEAKKLNETLEDIDLTAGIEYFRDQWEKEYE